MRAAFPAELVKLARSRVSAWVTVVLVLAVPLMAAGFVAAAEGDGSSQLAAKARVLIHGTGWAALTNTTGQLLSVAALLGVGFVVSWVFGREFSDVTIEPLLMSRPARGVLASAKFAAVLAWAAGTVLASTAVTLLVGALMRAAGSPWPGLGRMVIGAALTVLLTLPFGAVATLGRSALAGVGAVIGVIVVTQLLTVAGVGGWFPYAAPSLWLGMGGAALTAEPVQLLLVVPVAAAGWTATAWWWQHAELTSA